MDATTNHPALSDSELLELLALPPELARDPTEVEAELSEEEKRFQ